MITKYEKFMESKKDNTGAVRTYAPEMWKLIPSAVKALHKIFAKDGKKLYLVGGAVRDFLDGDTPKDFDVATNALPEDVIGMMETTDDFHIPTDGTVGARFGVIIVKPDEEKFTDDSDQIEIAGFRKDITKGRNPKVKLGVTIEDDVKRRDLTINAMFYDMDTKEVVDLVGGREDLKNRIIRMVGTAMKRIEEDPLRILRAFRFAARYAAPLTDDIIEAIKANRKLESIIDGELKRVSSEAIWTEFRKAWGQAQDFTKYLDFFTELDMWDEIFPGAKISEDYKRTTDFYVTVHALFKDSDLTPKQMKDQFGIEKKTANIVKFLNELTRLSSKNAARYKKDMIDRYHLGPETIREWIRINDIEDPIYYAFLRFKPVNATDLLAQGMKQGAELGIALAKQNQEAFEKLL